MKENWVKETCEKHKVYGSDGWKKLTLKERKSSLIDLWKKDRKQVSKHSIRKVIQSAQCDTEWWFWVTIMITILAHWRSA